MQKEVLILAMVGLFLPFAQAQSDAGSAGSKVLALESVWNQAEEKGDVGALDLLFDNSMIYIDEDGSLLNKAQFLTHVKKSDTRLQSLVTQTTGVRTYGEMTVVAGRYRAKGVERGKPYQRDGRFIDTWIFKGGTWVCVVAQSTPVLR